MLYSCTHMAAVGVKGLRHFSSLDTNTFSVLKVVGLCHALYKPTLHSHYFTYYTLYC